MGEKLYIFRDIIQTTESINKNEVHIIKKKGDNNCLYRCLSFFEGNEDFYSEIKELIINWIDNKLKKFENFFGEDDIKNISKTQLAQNGLNYMKIKDSI